MNIQTKPLVPKWLVPKIFEDHLCQNVPDYQKTKSFRAVPALSAGENYATTILRIEIEVELKDSKTKQISYVMKVPLSFPMFRELMKKQNIFGIEESMYRNYVPEMEQMLRDVGVEVKFGPQCFKLQLDKEIDYILLEDLRPRGFKNANRLEGLDTEHNKCVLKKLAQWHAASATRVETKGKYPENLTQGFFNEANLDVMRTIHASLGESLSKCIGTYRGNEVYGESVLKLQSEITDEFRKLKKIDPSEFNVLNHGDCWSNNIMFQYDAFGKIKETYLVDYQIPRYGTPAQDLYYFLISSTKFEIKLKDFDFFIKFYHENLIEHLRLLKYPKKLPKLMDIHVMLYKYGIWGYGTAIGTMSAVLLEPNEGASAENMLGENAAGKDLKLQMYTSPRYRRHIEAILPWLYDRGAIEIPKPTANIVF